MFKKIRSPGRHEAPGQFGLLATEVDSGEALAGDEVSSAHFAPTSGNEQSKEPPSNAPQDTPISASSAPTVVKH